MKAKNRQRYLVLVIILAFVGMLIGTGIYLLQPPHSVVLAEADPFTTTLESTQLISGQLPASLRNSLQTDHGAAPDVISIPSAGGLSCVPPVVLHGSIITGTSSQMTGRLVRDGVPSICGQDYSCSGIQSTSTKFSYQDFNFLNPSPDWQCVQVDVNAQNCGQQVYSAVYLNTFDPANLCGNIQGAMGFSTSGLYGYSLMVPPNTNFKIVNNTTGIVQPSSNCSDYTVTVSLCSAVPDIKVEKGLNPVTLHANGTGAITTTIPVYLSNTGNFTGTVDARSVDEKVNIEVLDNKPALAQTTFGHAGAIIPPGGTVSVTIPLVFSGSQYACLPRVYQITSQISMTQNTYYCNGTNPPASQIFAGVVLPTESFDEDGWAFQAAPGDHITVTVDTVSAATAFDPEACISGTPNGTCLPDLQGDDNFSCSFAPPAFACPRFGGELPADPDGDNIYYVRVNSGSGPINFAGPQGEYRGSILFVSGPTGACPMVQVLDNSVNSFLAAFNKSIDLMSAVPAPTSTVHGQVAPIQVVVPPSDPANPSCGILYLPVMLH